MATQQEFDDAAVRVKTLNSRPSNEHLLALYSLYKQATTGDVSGKKPSAFDFAGRAKYDAWKKLQGTSEEDARAQYVSLVNTLVAG